MKRVPRPSPAMVVAVISLIMAIGGTAFALPGRFSVGRDDLKQSVVGARAIGKVVLEHRWVMESRDAVANDGIFTESEGEIRCPARAPFAFDPSIGMMGPLAYERRRSVIANRWGGPGGYRFIVSGDEGPQVGYTMKVNCLPKR